MEFACKQIDVKDIIGCSLGLKKSEYKIFEALLIYKERVTIAQLSLKLKLDRTTVQKVVKEFVARGLVQRYQENLDNGGYVFTYKIKEKSELKKQIHKALDGWIQTTRSSIDTW